jgi:hypothetical protein
MIKRSIDFDSKDDYNRLKAAAVLSDQKIGEFIISMLDHWEKTKK